MNQRFNNTYRQNTVLQNKYVKKSPKVVVIGAGMAGLVSALLLANEGAEVTVLEAQKDCGGKMRQLSPGQPTAYTKEVEGIDSGPTVLTMKWVFEEIFAAVGADLESELDLTRLDILARHAWSADCGEQQLTLFADPGKNFDAVASFSGLAEAKKFAHFCKMTKDLYKVLETSIIREPTPSIKKLALSIGPRGLATLASVVPMRNLWDGLGATFKDQRLRQLFARYATYCGSSPWSAPATLMLISQVEMDGVWSVKGGMRTLAKTLERLARERGVQFKFKTRCKSIGVKDGSVQAVYTDHDEEILTDAVVFNGDVEALYCGLLGQDVQTQMKPSKDNKSERSLSAVTWTMRCKVKENRFKLDRHNVFFQNNYVNEFNDIFKYKRLPLTPTVYVCAQNRGTNNNQSSIEIDSDEPIFCLINAPAIGDSYDFSQQELEQCEMETFNLLSRCGLQIETEPSKTIRTQPKDFHQLFPSTGGALYGQATHGWMQVFSRPTATTQIRGLFTAGGSVHPGPGLPMAAMSGRLAAGAVTAHLGLTKR